MHLHSDLLFEWYCRHKRNLPWRTTRNPYRIWVSEIILQQTRISQGMSYYERFIERFPDVNSLADAGLDEVLRLWEGLGYYRRAQNMHKAAVFVRENHGNRFPSTYHELIRLPGIGDYTASAISSICAGERHPTIDGNVRRFVSRLYNIHEMPGLPGKVSEIRKMALHLIGTKDPGTMNQAMMEFGALQCVPGSPDCSRCPFHDCAALADHTIHLLPLRSKKGKMRERFLNYLVFTWKENDTPVFLINKRDETDIWANLYDFPCFETDHLPEPCLTEFRRVPMWCTLPENTPCTVRHHPYIHQLTHQRISARFYEFRCPSEPEWYNERLLKVPLDAFLALAKPRLISRYLADALPYL